MGVLYGFGNLIRKYQLLGELDAEFRIHITTLEIVSERNSVRAISKSVSESFPTSPKYYLCISFSKNRSKIWFEAFKNLIFLII